MFAPGEETLSVEEAEETSEVTSQERDKMLLHYRGRRRHLGVAPALSLISRFSSMHSVEYLE
ncbi:hypothetical protein RUM43_004944, partial [Polyplax serrata]